MDDEPKPGDSLERAFWTAKRIQQQRDRALTLIRERRVIRMRPESDALAKALDDVYTAIKTCVDIIEAEQSAALNEWYRGI